MYEELIDPLKSITECNSYLNVDENRLRTEYGENISNLIVHLRNDFFKTDASEVENDFCKRREKAEKDFLKLHPNVCSEVLKILVTDYLFNTR